MVAKLNQKSWISGMILTKSFSHSSSEEGLI